MIQYNKADIMDYLSTVQGKTYTMLGYTLVAVIISLIFAIKPGIESILSEKSQIDANQDTSATLTQNISDVKKLTAEYKQYIVPNLDLLYTAMPPEQGYASLFANAEALAIQDNVTFQEMDFTPIPDGNIDLSKLETAPLGAKSMYIRLTVSGSPTQDVKYLEDLENFPRSLNIYAADIGTNISNSISASAPVFDGNYILTSHIQTFYNINAL